MSKTGADFQRRPDEGPEKLQPWVRPEVVELPPLTELTLQTGGIPGSGSTAGASTVF